ncbi:unnamed protein product [Lasius platythorax]|uniref:Uncharacterized protein n=1 Tax=Lasius platythorax TaxID=488582 RepID=A0AAV2P8U5_9HYME
MKRKLKAENGRELVFEYPWRRYASSCLLPRVAQYLRGNGDLDKRGRCPIGFGEIAENRSFGSVQILADIHFAVQWPVPWSESEKIYSTQQRVA